ncbi:lactonase family protein [Cytobacillus sp. FJAT-54145]|uniref:Lactonase family protein n=1 Tax=Cytobacillus spartinae TaxID=3299023 RepID=A0ABW6KC09_9BACI
MSNNKKFLGYVGTYTKGESKGIYSFSLDTDSETITNVKVAAELDNPTYLAVSQDNQFVYSVIKEGDLGGVASYSVNNQTGELTALNSQLAEGAPPCHVSVGRGNHNVFTSNYHKGSVESFLINKDGSLNPVSSTVKHEGSGPDPRQEKPHTHYAAFTPDEKYVTAVELGADKLFTYTVNANGELHEVNRLDFKPGSGPRHLVFHPNNLFAYIMTEFSSEVVLLRYNSDNGSFEILQTISTIPSDFSENNQGSAIHISSDGKFIYAGNRGHNSITVFNVHQESGELTFIEHTSTEGNWPRDFALDPSENYLVASNQESSNLVLFKRDTSSGKLSLLQSDITVPDPVCVKFLNV